MHIFNFYMIAGHWFMDDPDYLESGEDPTLLEVVGGMNEALELVAKGHSSVQLAADTQPFDEAEELVLLESSGDKFGGYYRLRSLKGQVVELDIWLNQLVYIYFNQLPQKIYLKFN